MGVLWVLRIFLLHQAGLTVTMEPSSQEDTLVLLHVLFRHGNRTANGLEELYPKDPYLNETYFPFGLGQLTNIGKKKEYDIGRALRKKYHKFLGPHYFPEVVESWSTDYNRTKMSLQLVLAALFPPDYKTAWNQNLNWQPIPFNYKAASQDKILRGDICPYYQKLYEETIRSYRHQIQLAPYKTIFRYISEKTGLNVSTFHDVYNLYFGLATEEEWGFKLPAWTKPVWPTIIENLAVEEYFALTATKDQMRMASGCYFLKKVIQDTYSKIKNPKSKVKMYLYSAHENNIAQLLILLNVFKPVHIPRYGAYVVFEVHRYQNNYGIKIYYENYVSNEPQLLKLQSCDTFCEINKFVCLVQDYIPSENLCYKTG